VPASSAGVARPQSGREPPRGGCAVVRALETEPQLGSAEPNSLLAQKKSALMARYFFRTGYQGISVNDDGGESSRRCKMLKPTPPLRAAATHCRASSCMQLRDTTDRFALVSPER
jgi:hypothetical protein